MKTNILILIYAVQEYYKKCYNITLESKHDKHSYKITKYRNLPRY